MDLCAAARLSIFISALAAVPVCRSADPQASERANSVATSYVIETIAGTQAPGDGGSAQAAQLGSVEGIALDSTGNLYIADAVDGRVRKVNAATGIITTVAGTGRTGYFGDGGSALEADLNTPYDVAVDARGNVYIADLGNARVRKVTADGKIQTVAGEEPGTLVAPRNVLVDTSGNLYISDFGAHKIFRLTPAGEFVVAAGTGLPAYNGDGFGNLTNLSAPAGLATDAHGVVYVAESGSHRVRTLTSGILTTVLENVLLSSPTGVVVDRDGIVLATTVAEGAGGLLRRVLNGTVEPVNGFSSLGKLRDLAMDSTGRLYVAAGRQVWRVDKSGALTVFAGTGNYATPADSIKAKEAELLGPIGIATDQAGNLYVAEEGRKRIAKLDQQGLLTTVIKTGLTDPVSIAVDRSGQLWTADYAGNTIYGVMADGRITQVAGTGEAGYAGDGANARAARLNRPRGVAIDLNGNLFIADSQNHRVRRVSPSGTISTLAGNGVRGYSGEKGLAERAQLHTPAGVAVDLDGNVYIAEQGNHVIRKVGLDGFISTVAGTGEAGDTGDNGAATKARLNSPAAICFDSQGNLLIADTKNHRIRIVNANGEIRTIAGTGVPGFVGDLGPAELAQLRSPASVAADGTGHIYIADLENRFIRRLTPSAAPPVIETPAECRVAHAASLKASPFAPGQIVTIFGSGFAGPGGTEVQVNQAPAYVLYAGEGQVNAQIPYSVPLTAPAELMIRREGKPPCRVSLTMAEASPGLVTVQGDGQAVAVNENGSVNSADNPAGRGSVITLYATGEGRTDPESKDGKPAETPLPKPLLPVHVRIAGLPAEVLYAGAAPGLIGLMQINVRTPSGFAPSGVLPVELFVGSASSQSGVTIVVR